MNPWQVVNKLLDGEELTKDDRTCPPFFVLKILSFDRKLIHVVDKLNYFFNIDNEKWWKILQVCFSGYGKRWIDYLKVQKEKDVKIYNKFESRVKELYSWSEREFKINFETLVKNLDDQFLSGIGFDVKERKAIGKEFTTKSV